MNMNKATHPAFTKRSAVTPRNYAAGSFTSEDRHRAYTRAAMKQGKTVGDILAECMFQRMKMELLYK